MFLSKHKENGDTEFAPVYFNSTTKTVINSDKYMLDKSFQEFLYKTDKWNNESSRWVIKSVDKKYENISVFSPLSWSTYIELPCRLQNSMIF